MSIQKQISVVQENRVGALSKLCSVLAEKKVNILGICIHEIHDYGVLRIVVDNTERATEALKVANVSFSTTDVVVVETPHVPGALAQLAKKFSDAQINIDYAYATAASDKSLVVVKVAEPAKADRILA